MLPLLSLSRTRALTKHGSTAPKYNAFTWACKPTSLPARACPRTHTHAYTDTYIPRTHTPTRTYARQRGDVAWPESTTDTTVQGGLQRHLVADTDATRHKQIEKKNTRVLDSRYQRDMACFHPIHSSLFALAAELSMPIGTYTCSGHIYDFFFSCAYLGVRVPCHVFFFSLTIKHLFSVPVFFFSLRYFAERAELSFAGA